MAQCLVFSDASPLIGLSLVDGIGWLESLFGEVYITNKVVNELLPKGDKPGKSEIRAAIEKGALLVIEDICSKPIFPMLDEGEASTLRAALNQKKRCLVLIDETALIGIDEPGLSLRCVYDEENR